MIRVQVLGGVSIGSAGQRLAGRAAQRHPTALLALLAASHPNSISRDKLMALLWPERDLASARNLLNQAVHALRQALGPDAIGSTSVGLALVPEHAASDVCAFEGALAAGDLERAVALYAGPFLDGFFLDAAPEFERWVDSERGRLKRAYTRALEELAERSSANALPIESVQWWRKLAEAEPYNARVTLQLMRALGSAGDRAAAIREAQAHADRFEQDLDAKPDPEVAALAERMRLEPANLAATLPPEPGVPTPRAWFDDAGDRVVSEAGARRFFPGRLALIGVIGALAVWGAVSLRSLLPAESRPSLAVLPFENLSPDEEGRYFADGVHEAIISQLALIDAMDVRSRRSVMEFRDSNAGIPQIAEELTVRYVLEGSVRKSGQRVVITAQLIEASTDRHIWTESYERNFEDVFVIQADVATRIAKALDARLTPAERQRIETPPTDNAEAYYLYLQGRMVSRAGPAAVGDRAKAEQLLSAAIELDPEFALAHAWLSLVHADTYWWTEDRTSDRLERARASAETALRLDPELPDAYVAKALVHYWGERDYDRALNALNRALVFRPRHEESLVWIGNVRRRQGDFWGAIEAYRQAIAVEPRSSYAHLDLVRTLVSVGDVEEAHRAIDVWAAMAGTGVRFWDARVARNLEGNLARSGAILDSLVAEFGVSRLWQDVYTQRMYERDAAGALDALQHAPSLVTLSWIVQPVSELQGLAYQLQGDQQRARDAFETARLMIEERLDERGGDFRYQLAYGRILALLGEKEKALAAGNLAAEMMTIAKDAGDGTYTLYSLALINARVGELDAAVDLLETTLPIPSVATSPWVVRLDPVWDPLRGHPRFERLLERDVRRTPPVTPSP